MTADEPDGHVVWEAVPASFRSDGLVEVLGSPALVMGCVAGDVLRVEPDGRFRVVRRGPNLSIQAFRDPPFTSEAIQGLASEVEPLGGLVEAPGHGRFLVATIPATVSKAALESIVDRWATANGDPYWQYGAAVLDLGQDQLW